MAKIRFKPSKEKEPHVLEVRLSNGEVKELGSLSGDSLDVIDKLKEHGILTPKELGTLWGGLSELEKKVEKDSEQRVGISCGSNLLSKIRRTRGNLKDLKTVKGAGMNIGVVLTDSQGQRVSEFKPYSGSRIHDNDFNKMKRTFRRDMELLGVDSATIDQKIEEYDSAYSTYNRALDMFAQGYKRDFIARETGVNVNALRYWTSGGKPLALRRVDGGRKHDIKIPHGVSTDFAYLLGAYAGSSEVGYKQRWRIVEQEPEIVEHVYNVAKEIYSSKAEIRESKIGSRDVKSFQLSSVELMRYLNEITSGNTRIPWEHLCTDAERIEFMRGFFDLCGSVFISNLGGRYSVPRLEACKANNPDLIQDFTLLLGKLGILPNYQSPDYYFRDQKSGKRQKRGKRHMLRISGERNIQRFKELGGFTSERKSIRLQNCIAEGFHVKEWDYEDYYTARELRDKGLSFKKISEQTGIPSGTIGSWFHKGSKRTPLVPKRVVWYEEFQELAERMPDPEVIGLLYRDMGCPSTRARIIAKRRTIDEVRENMRILSENGIVPKSRISLLALSREQLEKRLGIAPPKAEAAVEVQKPEKPGVMPVEETAIPKKVGRVESRRDDRASAIETELKRLVAAYPRLTMKEEVFRVMIGYLSRKYGFKREDLGLRAFGLLIENGFDITSKMESVLLGSYDQDWTDKGTVSSLIDFTKDTEDM